MSLPRFILPHKLSPAEGLLLPLDPPQVRHLLALRLQPGDALEVLLPAGPWRAELAALDKRGAFLRLVGPLGEDREPPIPIQVCLPLTAQLSLWDEFLPGVVELGATLIQPVIYARSEYDARKTAARTERWHRLVLGACEQSHRTRIPELREPIPFEALLRWEAPQKWVAYELPTGQPNPPLRSEGIALTHGPEGGISDGEYEALTKADWHPVSMGRSILRAVSCPAALLGAVQYGLGMECCKGAINPG